MTSHPVKVSADATLVFPLIVSQTFLKEVARRRSGVTDADGNDMTVGDRQKDVSK